MLEVKKIKVLESNEGDISDHHYSEYIKVLDSKEGDISDRHYSEYIYKR